MEIRVAGFTNQKPKRCLPNGLPFVKRESARAKCTAQRLTSWMKRSAHSVSLACSLRVRPC